MSAPRATRTAVLLLWSLLLCGPALCLDQLRDKSDSLRDTIHSAVNDAVRQHCAGPEQAASTSCVSLCPEGFTACAGHCYSLQLRPADYATAERRCAALNATLAIPRRRVDNLCVAGLSEGRRVWLGVTDRGEEGLFLAADGTPLGELDGHRWRHGNPDDYRRVDPQGEDCVEMASASARHFSEWNDESCRTLLMPMCQSV